MCFLSLLPNTIPLMVTLSNEATDRGRGNPLTRLGFVGGARLGLRASGEEGAGNALQP